MNAFDLTTITAKLDRLAIFQAQQDAARLTYEDQRRAIIPPEVAQALDDLETEYKLEVTGAAINIDALTAEIKAAVLAAGATVKGDYLQAVWSKPRVTWDSKLLDGYALAYPEINAARKEGEPSVSIRGVK